VTGDFRKGVDAGVHGGKKKKNQKPKEKKLRKKAVGMDGGGHDIWFVG